MNFKEIHELFSNPENIKQQVLDGQVFTDQAIINIIEEYNKDKSRFSPKRFSTRGVLRNYHRILGKVEKELDKEKAKFLEVTGLSHEEYENLTPMEKAQLNIQLKQFKHVEHLKKMTAWNTLSNGLDKF